MRKFTALLGATTFALATALSASVMAAPQGFAQGNGYQDVNGFQGHGHPRGFQNIQTMTVAQVKQHSFDDQRVALVGKLTKYYGGDHYEFVDQTGSIMVELDDDRSWSHINKDQTIRIFAKVDREWDHVTLDVKRAHAVR